MSLFRESYLRLLESKAPKYLRRLRKSGRLDEVLQEADELAQSRRNELRDEIAPRLDPNPVDTLAKARRLRTAASIAEEFVLEEMREEVELLGSESSPEAITGSPSPMS